MIGDRSGGDPAVSLGRSTGVIVVNTILGAALGFVALKTLALEAGPYAEALLGELAFAIGLAGLLGLMLDLGLGSAHIRRVSEGRDLATAVGSYAAATLVLVTTFLVLATVAAWAAAQSGVLTDTSATAVALAALYFAFLELRTLFTATFEGRREFAKSQLAILTENVTRVALMILVAVAFAGVALGHGPLAGQVGGRAADLVSTRTADLLAASYAVGAFVSLLIAWLQFRRGYPIGRPDLAVIRDYWSFGRHILVVGVVAGAYASFDRVVVTAFWEPENTGRYFGAQRLSEFVLVLSLAVYAVLFPVLSSGYARDEHALVRAATESALRHVNMTVVPLVAFTVSMATPLLSLVLSGFFTPAAPTLRLLALAALVYALTVPYSSLLHARGRPDLTARVALVALLVNVGLNLALVPQAGTLGLPLAGLAERGAALATLLAVSVQLTLLRRAAATLDEPVAIRGMIRHLGAGAAMAGILWPLAPGPADAHWYLVLGLGVLGLAIYVAVLAAVGEFTRADARLYLQLLNPAALARHAADEVRAYGPGR